MYLINNQLTWSVLAAQREDGFLLGILESAINLFVESDVVLQFPLEFASGDFEVSDDSIDDVHLRERQLLKNEQ